MMELLLEIVIFVLQIAATALVLGAIVVGVIGAALWFLEKSPDWSRLAWAIFWLLAIAAFLFLVIGTEKGLLTWPEEMPW
ncbi:hypothetical protein [Candidatus Palauibacter sp.]|uniref:hypothetical protein n=1 Tax=Candidatus Palauibacter sp. TaxID=3101350 RepID=UPI003B0158EA